jgi:hypothetical protein
MNTKTAARIYSQMAPVFMRLRVIDRWRLSPFISTTSVSVKISMASISAALSSRTPLAFKENERSMTVTLEPNFVRKIASWTQLLPPPTTMISRSL